MIWKIGMGRCFGNVEEWEKQLWKDLSKFETIEESCDLMEEKLDLERIQVELEKASLEYFVLEKEIGILNSSII